MARNGSNHDWGAIRTAFEAGDPWSTLMKMASKGAISKHSRDEGWDRSGRTGNGRMNNEQGDVQSPHTQGARPSIRRARVGQEGMNSRGNEQGGVQSQTQGARPKNSTDVKRKSKPTVDERRALRDAAGVKAELGRVSAEIADLQEQIRQSHRAGLVQEGTFAELQDWTPEPLEDTFEPLTLTVEVEPLEWTEPEPLEKTPKK